MELGKLPKLREPGKGNNMKTIKELNQKAWYRLLKAFYILTFVLLQLVAIILIQDQNRDNTEQLPKDEHYSEIGKLVKADYPEYKDSTDLEIGKQLFEKNYYTWSQYEGEKVDNNYNTIVTEHLTQKEKIIAYLIPSSIILGIYLLTLGIFYYVVCGSIFPKKG
jgi:uncharacterized membrane protein YiaA